MGEREDVMRYAFRADVGLDAARKALDAGSCQVWEWAMDYLVLSKNYPEAEARRCMTAAGYFPSFRD